MASEQTHIARAETDLRLAFALFESGQNLHWSVTIAFYSCLHIFDAYLAASGIVSDNSKKSHVWRKSLVAKHLGSELGTQYISLYESSMQARYFSHADFPTRVDEARRVLQTAQSFNQQLTRKLEIRRFL